MKKNYQVKSLLAIVLVVLVALLIDLDFKNWRKTERVIEHDIHSYYGYLPALFIYDDLKVEKSDYKYDDNGYWFWMVATPDNKSVFRMTCGLAILYSPFFLVAHAVADWFDYPKTGFSEPYKFFLLLSSLFYLFVGLYFVRKILNHLNFSESQIAITLLLLGLGTNLLCYSSQSGTMSHVYSFCLIAIFAYSSIKWYSGKKMVYLWIAALFIGLISLVRLTNIIVFLFFILYGVKSINEIRDRKVSWIHLGILFLGVIVVWIPQLIYWKTVTGSYLVFSYGDEGKFYFFDPMIYRGLVSFRKGWLIYTPIMTFAIIGIFMMKSQLIEARQAVVIFLLLNIYIVFSWWCWWYGGSFGQRALIDSYAILAIPLASFVQKVWESRIWVRSLVVVLSLFFIWLNIFQTYQYEFESLHYEGMSQKLYFKQFGKLDKIEDFDKFLSLPNSHDALHRK
ncbi:MAG: hypothetical protein IPN36_14455 [Bacteroidetes bacterium]|nr:hypothetical protein [Bacteroidota bacterium]